MYILFDIGGTNTRITTTEDLLSFSVPTIFPTLKVFDDGVKQIKKVINELSDGQIIEGIAGGIAGIIDPISGKLFYSPNLPEWQGNSLSQSLSSIAQTFMENDAALAGLGEAVSGAGQDHEIVAYMTISTGIGGARIVKNKIDIHRVGFEPGKQIIDRERMHSVEQLASGKAIEEKHGVKPKEVYDPAIWNKAAKDIAVCLFNIVTLWSPDVIVLGGPMILKKPGIDIVEVEEWLKEPMKIYPIGPKIVLSKLKDEAGLYGALELLRQKLG